MPKDINKIETDKWIVAMRELYLEFYKELKKYHGGDYISFNDQLGTAEKPGKIVEEYSESFKLLKKNLEKDADESYIDTYDKAALCIQSFLKYKPFNLDIPKAMENLNLDLQIKFPNEYFVLPFLQTIFKAETEDNDGILKLDKRYRGNLINLLHQYCEGTISLDTSSFKHIISQIEGRYFIHS